MLSKRVHYGRDSDYNHWDDGVGRERETRMLKLLTVVVAGILTVVTLRRVFQQLQAQKSRAVTRRAGDSRSIRRLRRDPQTGVYYPEG
jgi:hypothetical protein